MAEAYNPLDNLPVLSEMQLRAKFSFLELLTHPYKSVQLHRAKARVLKLADFAMQHPERGIDSAKIPTAVGVRFWHERNVDDLDSINVAALFKGRGGAFSGIAARVEICGDLGPHTVKDYDSRISIHGEDISLGGLMKHLKDAQEKLSV